jgi:hypothetical protein
MDILLVTSPGPRMQQTDPFQALLDQRYKVTQVLRRFRNVRSLALFLFV